MSQVLQWFHKLVLSVIACTLLHIVPLLCPLTVVSDSCHWLFFPIIPKFTYTCRSDFSHFCGWKFGSCLKEFPHLWAHISQLHAIKAYEHKATTTSIFGTGTDVVNVGSYKTFIFVFNIHINSAIACSFVVANQHWFQFSTMTSATSFPFL